MAGSFGDEKILLALPGIQRFPARSVSSLASKLSDPFPLLHEANSPQSAASRKVINISKSKCWKMTS